MILALSTYFLVLFHTDNYGAGHAGFVVIPSRYYSKEACESAGAATKINYICVEAPQ